MAEQESDPIGSVTRIDAPHPVSLESVPAAGVPAAGEGRSGPVEAKSAVSGLNLQVHAGQLARHLRSRQRDIDQREAQLNARVAQLEKELRASRLWIQERNAEQEDRERELEQRASELDEHLHGISTHEITADGRLCAKLDEIQKRQSEVESAERRMIESQQRLATEAESVRVATERLREERRQLDKRSALAEQEWNARRLELDELHHRLLSNLELRRQSLEENVSGRPSKAASEQLAHQEQRLADALRQLGESESMVSRRLAELESEKQRFDRERKQFSEEAGERRRALADDKRRLEGRLEASQRRIELQRHEIERRESVTQHLRDEATRLHRETLEMRLVVEQLWLRLVDSGSAAEVTRSIGNLRRRLADQFRLERDETATQLSELREFGERLEKRRQILKTQRDQLHAWFIRRQDELEEQAARLVARETELAQEQTTLRDQEESWAAERQDLLGQIRRLKSQLTRSAVPA